jgi:SPP1 gp7 family putative phage head morphogenesis protein
MSIISDLAVADKLADKTLATMERQIANQYKAAYTDMRGVFAEAFAKYEQGGTLTYNEMMKYNRLKSMQTELNKTLAELYADDTSILNKGLTSTYQDSYYRAAYSIEKEIQAKLSYMPLDTARIKAAIQNPISGLTLNETLIKNKANIISKINQEITRGLIQGTSYGKMARAIKETLGGDAGKAIRVAQTEAHRVHNQARWESMKHADDLGVEMVKVWVSTLDSRTRPAHQSLDGREVKVEDNFSSSQGGNGPTPGQMGTAADDINCRCTFVIRPVGFKPEFRRIRGEGQVPYTTYDDWAKAKGLKGT